MLLRFMKLETGTVDGIQEQPHRFCQANLHFGAKPSSFAAVLAKNKCVGIYRLLLNQSKVNVIL